VNQNGVVVSSEKDGVNNEFLKDVCRSLVIKFIILSFRIFMEDDMCVG
jgi:hypothetical protein